MCARSLILKTVRIQTASRVMRQIFNMTNGLGRARNFRYTLGSCYELIVLGPSRSAFRSIKVANSSHEQCQNDYLTKVMSWTRNE
jgi:hypothetical protein